MPVECRYKLLIPSLIVFLSLCLPSALFAEAPIPDDPYNLLKEIPSFYDLFTQKGLEAYSADIKIDGAIAQTLSNLASEKNLPPPEFIEYYTVKEGFVFRIKNSTYPSLLKQVIGEMFTPVQVFDRVIALIESKRELSWFQHFKSVTHVDAKWIQYQETPHIRLVFTANPGETIEKHDDPNGTTTSTQAMTFIIQPAAKTIRLLKTDQIERSKDGERKTEKKFIFEYQTFDNRQMPSELKIEKDGKEEVRLKAVYDKKKNLIVYAEKAFTFTGSSGTRETIRLHYSNYRFNKDVDFSYLEKNGNTGASLANEAEAERMYNKAKNLILNGKTKEATNLLRKIIKEHSETSYAEQAKTLLDGLPE